MKTSTLNIIVNSFKPLNPCEKSADYNHRFLVFGLKSLFTRFLMLVHSSKLKKPKCPSAVIPSFRCYSVFPYFRPCTTVQAETSFEVKPAADVPKLVTSSHWLSLHAKIGSTEYFRHNRHINRHLRHNFTTVQAETSFEIKPAADVPTLVTSSHRLSLHA